MSDSDNNNNFSLDFKRLKPRYITLNEDIFLTLSGDTLKVYLSLRYISDYSNECSNVKKNIKSICNKSQVKRSRCFDALRELEAAGLLKRESNPGYQSTYWVAQDLGYFLPDEANTPEPPPDNEETKSTEIDQIPVQDINYPVQDTNYPVQEADTITNISSTISSQLKHSVDFDKSTSYKDDALFMLFYSIYPNKQKPEIARKAFYKHKPDEDFVSMLCADIAKRVENNWKNRHKNKIPHPSTYLNTKEWEGEIYAPESNIASLPVKPPRYTMTELLGGL